MEFSMQELEWVAIPFSRGSSQPRHRIHVFCIAGRFFTIWAIKEAQALNEGVLLIYLTDEDTEFQRSSLTGPRIDAE